MEEHMHRLLTGTVSNLETKHRQYFDKGRGFEVCVYVRNGCNQARVYLTDTPKKYGLQQ